LVKNTGYNYDKETCKIRFVDNDIKNALWNSRDNLDLQVDLSCNVRVISHKKRGLSSDLTNDLLRTKLVTGTNTCSCDVKYYSKGKVTHYTTLYSKLTSSYTGRKNVDQVWFKCERSENYNKWCISEKNKKIEAEKERKRKAEEERLRKIKLAEEKRLKELEEKKRQEEAQKEKERLEELAKKFPKPDLDKKSITGLKCPVGYKYDQSIPYVACYNTSDLDALRSKDYLPMWRGTKRASYCCFKNKLPLQQNCSDLKLELDKRHWKRCPIGKINNLGYFSYEGCYVVSNKQCCRKSEKECDEGRKENWKYGINWSYNMLFEDVEEDNVTSKLVYNERIEWEITKGMISNDKKAFDFNNYDCAKNVIGKQTRKSRRR